MRFLALAALLCAACPSTKPSPERENRNPYKDVTPQKVKAKVEAIEQQEDRRNEQRMEQMK